MALGASRSPTWRTQLRRLLRYLKYFLCVGSPWLDVPALWWAVWWCACEQEMTCGTGLMFFVLEIIEGDGAVHLQSSRVSANAASFGEWGGVFCIMF